jgi:hypothetical protein
MSLKSSLPQPTKSDSMVLIPDTYQRARFPTESRTMSGIGRNLSGKRHRPQILGNTGVPLGEGRRIGSTVPHIERLLAATEQNEEG